MISYKNYGGEFSENPQSETRPHSSPAPSCGREISRGRANPKPQKNSLPCRVRIVSVSFVGIFCKMGFDFFKQTPPKENYDTAKFRCASILSTRFLKSK